MKLGIFGLPKCGKTTLFRALTGHSDLDGAKRSSHEPLVGVVKIDDERLTVLAQHFKPKKVTPVTVEYWDLPGITDGNLEDGGRCSLPDGFLAQIRSMDAIIHCLRFFDSDFIGSPSDPFKDFLRIEEEMLLSDLSIIEKRLDRLEKDLQKLRKEAIKDAVVECELLKQAKDILDQGKPLRTFPPALSSEKLRSYAFLSAKPSLVLINAGQEKSHEQLARVLKTLQDHIKDQPNIIADALFADNEAEIARLSPEEAKEFLADLKVESSAKQRIVKTSFDLLQLIVFLTAGEKEVRAWQIKKGSTALIAAEAIHTDIARGFIRAEVVYYEDFKKAGSMQIAQKEAKVRLEGKEYIVKDGDMILFRFNV